MLYRLLGAAALVLGVAIPGATPLAAQQPDSARRPHVMATVVVSGRPTRRATAAENSRLRREVARYDSRILTLQHQLETRPVPAADTTVATP